MGKGVRQLNRTRLRREKDKIAETERSKQLETEEKKRREKVDEAKVKELKKKKELKSHIYFKNVYIL